MTQVQRFLFEQLGQMDGLFAPSRQDSMCRSATHQLRIAFLEDGNPLRKGGKGRQDFARLLGKLEEKEVVTLNRKGKNRWPCVRLTDAAENSLRNTLSLPTLAAGESSLKEIARLSDEANRIWVPENVLTTGSWEHEEILLTQNMAAPALCRGWLDSGCTTQGAAAYCVSDAGRQALADLEEWDDPEPVPFSKDGWKVFCEAFNAKRAELISMNAPDPTNIAPIPLSAAVFDWPKEVVTC